MEEWLKIQEKMWNTNDSNVINTRPLFMEFIKQCQKNTRSNLPEFLEQSDQPHGLNPLRIFKELKEP